MAVVQFDNAHRTPAHVPASILLQYLDETKEKTHIKGLSFAKEVLRDEDIEALVEFLKTNAEQIHLETLRLPQNNDLTWVSCTALSNALPSTAFCALRELDLSGNPVLLQSAGLHALVEALTDVSHPVASPLTRLNLCSCGLTGTKGVHAIASLLRNNDKITELLLGHNRLGGTKSCKVLASSFEHNTALRKLDLSYNKICDRGVGLLMASLDAEVSPNSSLAELDFTFNKIGPAGARHISDLLLAGRNKTLTKLNLSLNQVGSQGACDLGSVLQFSHTLQELNLSRNNIGDGVCSLADGLQHNGGDTVLRRLDLSWNSITDAGASKLAEVLRGNSVLEHLNLASNAIGDAGVAALAHALYADLALQELNLVGNQLRDPTPLVNLICHEASGTLQTIGYEKNNLSPEKEALIEAAFVFRQNKRTWLGKLLRDMEHKKLVSWNLLSRNHGDEEMIALARQLAEYSHVTVGTAFFSGERITVRGIAALARDALMNPATRNRFQRMFIRNAPNVALEGVSVLAQALLSPRCPLWCLSLTHCNIGPDGAELLANAVKRNHNLKRLCLEQNNIGSAGVKVLLLSVSDHPSLVSLNVADNGLTDHGLSAMLPIRRLEELYLGCNYLTDAGALDLSKAVMDCESLRWLDVSQNCLTWKGCQTLRIFLPSEFMLSCDHQRPKRERSRSDMVAATA